MQIEKRAEHSLAPHTRNPTALGGAKYDGADTSAAPKAKVLNKNLISET
jgi:hypothetical protein